MASDHQQKTTLPVRSKNSYWFQQNLLPVPAVPGGVWFRPWSKLAVAALCSFLTVDMPGCCTVCRRWQPCALQLAAPTPRLSWGEKVKVGARPCGERPLASHLAASVATPPLQRAPVGLVRWCVRGCGYFRSEAEEEETCGQALWRRRDMDKMGLQACTWLTPDVSGTHACQRNRRVVRPAHRPRTIPNRKSTYPNCMHAYSRIDRQVIISLQIARRSKHAPISGQTKNKRAKGNLMKRNKFQNKSLCPPKERTTQLP